MLRLLAGLTIGIYLGFRAPKYAPRLLEMCQQCFDDVHNRAHREDQQ